MPSKPTKDDENVTTNVEDTSADFGKGQATPVYQKTELDTKIEDENRDAVNEQAEVAGEYVDDPGQLSEDLQGDYQRRVQMGVNPTELTYDDDTVESVVVHEDDSVKVTENKPKAEGKVSTTPKE